MKASVRLKVGKKEGLKRGGKKCILEQLSNLSKGLDIIFKLVTLMSICLHMYNFFFFPNIRCNVGTTLLFAWNAAEHSAECVNAHLPGL